MDRQFFNEYSFIIGCDEVGRGPIAGPVVGCAVKIASNKRLFCDLKKMGFNDSKKLTSKKRLELLSKIQLSVSELQTQVVYEAYEGIEFVLWELGPSEIDQMNILKASLWCMSQAASMLYCDRSIVLIDGNQNFADGKMQTQTVIKGDTKSVAIAVASVVAKEFRDEKMRVLDGLYPGYGLASHAGYPTRLHREAVAALGVSPIHRKSFKGVKEYVL